MTVRFIEDGAGVAGDLRAHVDFGDVGSRVALKMDLAALPSDRRQDRAKSGFEASVVIAGYKFHSVQATFDETLQEATPVDLGFGERDAAAEDGSLAVCTDTGSDQDGAIDHAAAMANFEVGRVEGRDSGLGRACGFASARAGQTLEPVLREQFQGGSHRGSVDLVVGHFQFQVRV